MQKTEGLQGSRVPTGGSSSSPACHSRRWKGCRWPSACATSVAPEATRMSTFERFLTLCGSRTIVVGIVLGEPRARRVPGDRRVGVRRVNLPVALLVWLMIIPMLVGSISARSAACVGTGAASASRCSSTGR